MSFQNIADFAYPNTDMHIWLEWNEEGTSARKPDSRARQQTTK